VILFFFVAALSPISNITGKNDEPKKGCIPDFRIAIYLKAKKGTIQDT
jgi:hypothetical protein